jgi:hypothetical protein
MTKVGIYTMHADHNFGAMLQAYATEHFINSNGFDAEIVNYYPLHVERSNKFVPNKFSFKGYIRGFYAKLSRNMREKNRRFTMFHRSMKLSGRYYSLDEIYNRKTDYDIHLVGSDQVWNIENGIPERAYFYLDFLTNNEKKISYAPSIASDHIPDAIQPRMKSLLSRFDFLSVREDVGVQLVEELIERKVKHVVDPTFLLDKQVWFNKIGEHRLIETPYILYYGFDTDTNTQAVITHAKKTLGIQTVIVTPQPSTPFKADKVITSVGPLEFLRLVKDAALVITSSFHGVAFSINFNVNFFALKYKKRNSRVESLLRVADLSDRIVPDLENFIRTDVKYYTIDFSKHNEKLQLHINESKNWLLKSLGSL